MKFEEYQGSMRRLRSLKMSRGIWAIRIIVVGALNLQASPNQSKSDMLRMQLYFATEGRIPGAIAKLEKDYESFFDHRHTAV